MQKRIRLKNILTNIVAWKTYEMIHLIHCVLYFCFLPLKLADWHYLHNVYGKEVINSAFPRTEHHHRKVWWKSNIDTFNCSSEKASRNGIICRMYNPLAIMECPPWPIGRELAILCQQNKAKILTSMKDLGHLFRRRWKRTSWNSVGDVLGVIPAFISSSISSSTTCSKDLPMYCDLPRTWSYKVLWLIWLYMQMKGCIALTKYLASISI